MTNRTRHPPMYCDRDNDVANTYIEYPVLTDANSYVVSGALGRIEKPWIRGRQFETIKDAVVWVEFTFGGYYERIRGAEPDRWAFRVARGSHREYKGGIAVVMVESEPGRKAKFRAV